MLEHENVKKSISIYGLNVKFSKLLTCFILTSYNTIHKYRLVKKRVSYKGEVTSGKIRKSSKKNSFFINVIHLP